MASMFRTLLPLAFIITALTAANLYDVGSQRQQHNHRQQQEPPQPGAPNQQIAAFIGEMEQLVLNTTDRALLITTDVYRSIGAEMAPPLRTATEPLLHHYTDAVAEALSGNYSYPAKRQLFGQFKRTNQQIEQLRAQLAPQQAAFQYQLISNEFYSEGRNHTGFDNLYLDFIGEFERASQRLWAQLSERTVEEQQELLEILDEISLEEQLREKDKLYDEFIEMYLFKDVNVDNKDLL